MVPIEVVLGLRNLDELLDRFHRRRHRDTACLSAGATRRTSRFVFRSVSV